MKEMIIEALGLAKKFYDEELAGNHDHNDADLIRYYALEGVIADECPYEVGYSGWYGAICWLKDMLIR